MEDQHEEPILDGELGLTISDSDSEGAVCEDDRFRLGVPPVARAITNLINDLNALMANVNTEIDD